MNLQEIKLKNFFGELPRQINSNFQVVEDYIDSFYNGTQQIFTQPLTTTGRVKATTGEFINLICDNLTIRTTDTSTVDPEIDPDNLQYVTAYIASAYVLRVADPSNNWETRFTDDTLYNWLDAPLNQKYYKFNNIISVGINAVEVGQEIYIMYDRNIDSGSDYEIIMDPNDAVTGEQRVLYFDPIYGPISYHTLICVSITPEFGSVWAVKEWAGAFGSKLVNY